MPTLPVDDDLWQQASEAAAAQGKTVDECGGPLGVKQQYVVAHQTIYHDAERASHIVLPLQHP